MSNLYRRANTTADVASSYMRTMKGVSPAMGAARGYKAGTVFEQRNRELQRREDTDQFNRAAYWGKLERDAKVKERETAGGIAAIATGNTRDAYKAVQDSGKYPLLDAVTYDELTGFAQTTKQGSALIKQGKADDLVKFEKDQKIQAAELAERKQTEVERNNRAQNRADKLKATTDKNESIGIKTADSNAIGRIISGAFGGDYDMKTGTYIIKDNAKRLAALAAHARSEQVKTEQPGIGPAEASALALKEFGIDIPQSTPQRPVRVYDMESRSLK